MCLFKDEPYENDDPHTSQENAFSAVWVNMWRLKPDPSENAEPHTSQENGFSPVCVRM